MVSCLGYVKRVVMALVMLNISAMALAEPEKNGDYSVSVGFAQWANAAQAKASLLPRLLTECPKGFEIIREIYIPKPMGKIELTLTYSCVE